MAERPFKGPLGEKVWANVCQQCWKEWIAMGTKVINELRLPMHDPQAQEMYDKHMAECAKICKECAKECRGMLKHDAK